MSVAVSIAEHYATNANARLNGRASLAVRRGSPRKGQTMRGTQFAQLTAFAAVAEHRSFTRAAVQVGIALPTMSQTIRSLEVPGNVTHAAFAANGEVAALGLGDGTLAVWDVKAGKELRQWKAPHPQNRCRYAGRPAARVVAPEPCRAECR